jgi:hypothetical protein
MMRERTGIFYRRAIGIADFPETTARCCPMGCTFGRTRRIFSSLNDAMNREGLQHETHYLIGSWIWRRSVDRNGRDTSCRNRFFLPRGYTDG